jgi:GNAT superfamily N-acetyltransferase
MILRHARNHYVVDGDDYSPYGPYPSKKLPGPARRFWLRMCLAEAEEAIVAYEDRVLVGFFRFTVYHRANGTTMLIAAGTWVDTAYRKSGLGRRMWDRAIEIGNERGASPIDEIDVSLGSKLGGRFVDKLVEAYPLLRWEVGGELGPRAQENRREWLERDQFNRLLTDMMQEEEHAAE